MVCVDAEESTVPCFCSELGSRWPFGCSAQPLGVTGCQEPEMERTAVKQNLQLYTLVLLLGR